MYIHIYTRKNEYFIHVFDICLKGSQMGTFKDLLMEGSQRRTQPMADGEVVDKCTCFLSYIMWVFHTSI